jgi:hypothetical protein
LGYDQGDEGLPQEFSNECLSHGVLEVDEDEDAELEAMAQREMDFDDVVDLANRPWPRPPTVPVDRQVICEPMTSVDSRPSSHGRRPQPPVGRRPPSAGRRSPSLDAAVRSYPPSMPSVPYPRPLPKPAQRKSVESSAQGLEKRDSLISSILGLDPAVPQRSVTPSKKQTSSARSHSKGPVMNDLRPRSLPPKGISPTQAFAPSQLSFLTPRGKDGNSHMGNMQRLGQHDRSPREARQHGTAADWRVQRSGEPLSMPSLHQLPAKPSRREKLPPVSSMSLSGGGWKKKSGGLYA